MLVGAQRIGAQQVQHPLGRGTFQYAAAAPPIGRRLAGEVLARRDVEFVVHNRVPRRILVDVGGAVANPLARHENRQLDVVLDLAHFERRGMAVPHRIVDQSLVLAHLLGAGAIRYPRRPNHRAVVAHVIDDPHESVVEHGNRLVKDFLQGRHGGASRRVRGGALRLDFALLFRRQPIRLRRSVRHDKSRAGLVGGHGANPTSVRTPGESHTACVTR